MHDKDGNLLLLPISVDVSMAKWRAFQRSKKFMKIKAVSKGISALCARMQKGSILMRKAYLLCKFRGQSKNFARNFTLTPPIRTELHIVGACRPLLMKVCL